MTGPTHRLSTAMHLMIDPGQTYRRAVSARPRGSWLRALRVPAATALLLGLTTSIAAAGRVSAPLVASQAVVWSFVPMLQLLNAVAAVASVRGRPVDIPRAVELLFAAHAPWSLWVLVFGASQGPSQRAVMVALGALALALTARMVGAFHREVLGLTPTRARTRTALHQAATVLLILAFVELSTRLSVRLVGFVR